MVLWNWAERGGANIRGREIMMIQLFLVKKKRENKRKKGREKSREKWGENGGKKGVGGKCGGFLEGEFGGF